MVLQMSTPFLVTIRRLAYSDDMQNGKLAAASYWPSSEMIPEKDDSTDRTHTNWMIELG